MHAAVFVFVASGIVSWFKPLPEYQGMRVCAFNDRALIGKQLEIIDDDNRRISHCTVIGLGPYEPGRVLDVSPVVRDDLGLLGPGTAHVRVYRQIGEYHASKPQH